MGKTIKKIFTEKELKEIPEMYKSGTTITKIRKCMHTSWKNIHQILCNNGINIKDGDNGLPHRKPSGYWNNKERCAEAAKQCRNRGDFGKKFKTAYYYSLKNGWLPDFDQYFSLEKIYFKYEDKIHCVYSYEITKKKAVYVGRTNNIKRRHTEHKLGIMYTNHKIYNDTIKNYCDNNKIKLPEPKILENNLNALESRKKEKEWIIWYESNGWVVLNKATTGVGSSSLGSTMRKWTYEACKDAASQCISKADYKKKFSTASRVATQNKWIDDFFVNIKKTNGCFDNVESCINEAKKYKNLTDIKKNYPFLYQKICKNKWNEEIRIACGWEKYGEVKKNKIYDTKDVNKIKSELAFIDIKVSKMSEYEKKIYYHISHFDCKLLDDSVYGCRLNFLVNHEIIIGVDTIKGNLEFMNRTSHMVFLDELIKYNNFGYPMIHIFDCDLIENEHVVFDKIDTMLGVVIADDKISGRKCEVKEISKYEASLFLNENHIQGECTASLYIGAFYGNELVGVMCFRFGGTSCKNEWELVRFACKINTITRGVGGKMLKKFIDVYEPLKIVSFCDRRYLKDMDNNFYTKNRFVIDRINRPDYYYVDRNAIIPKTYHKLYFNKKKLSKQYGFPMTMTETEMAKELGYDRIWNCGLIRYVWKKENH